VRRYEDSLEKMGTRWGKYGGAPPAKDNLEFCMSIFGVKLGRENGRGGDRKNVKEGIQVAGGLPITKYGGGRLTVLEENKRKKFLEKDRKEEFEKFVGLVSPTGGVYSRGVRFRQEGRSGDNIEEDFR